MVYYFGFLLYVAAKSVEKMNRRMTDKHNSEPFFEGLVKSDKKCRGPFPPSQCTQYDKTLVSLLHDEKIQDKLDRKKFPHLMKQVNTCHDSESDLPLYTESTCDDFHHLLCYLLCNFRQSLKTLCEFNRRLRKRPKTKEQKDKLWWEDERQLKDGLKCGKSFGAAVSDLTIFGMLLHAVVMSSSLHVHIDRCTLPDVSHADGDATQRQDEETDKTDEEIDKTDEEIDKSDEELQNIRQMPVREGYRTWLQLQVALFEAVNHLTHYTVQNQATIEIKVLAVEHPGSSTC